MNRLSSSGVALSAPLSLLLLLVFLVPLALLFPISLQPFQDGAAGSGLTLGNYSELVTDSFLRSVVVETLLLGLVVTLVCLVLGYPLAYYIVQATPRMRLALTLLVIFPMLLNVVVRSFGWIALLANRGLVNNLLRDIGITDAPIRMLFNHFSVLVGLVHVFLPFMVLMLIPAIQAIPKDVQNAAYTLAATRRRVLWSVTLPMSMPGILSGSILVFVLSISALVTPRMLGGGSYKVMATLIYDDFLQTLNWQAGAAMAFALTGMTMVLVFLSSKLLNKFGGNE